MPPEAGSRPLIVAHRGACGHGPENTLPAFRQAWALGADAIEGDFRLTADGQIVCIHDADTRRVAGTRLVVAESTLEALRRLDVGSWYAASFRDARIPTLAEVLATIPGGKRLYLEVKSGPELIPPLLEVIRQAGLGAEQVVVISFDTAVIRTLKDQAPGLRAFWLCSCRRDAHGRFQPTSQEIIQTLVQCGADGFGAHGRLDDGTFIQDILAGGFEFHVWTLNDPRQALWFMEQGVRSITTDYPDRLLDRLARRE
jgi:glycerophosphoryl diester phosphodiesterase